MCKRFYVKNAKNIYSRKCIYYALKCAFLCPKTYFSYARKMCFSLCPKMYLLCTKMCLVMLDNVFRYSRECICYALKCAFLCPKNLSFTMYEKMFNRMYLLCTNMCFLIPKNVFFFTMYEKIFKICICYALKCAFLCPKNLIFTMYEKIFNIQSEDFHTWAWASFSFHESGPFSRKLNSIALYLKYPLHRSEFAPITTKGNFATHLEQNVCLCLFYYSYFVLCSLFVSLFSFGWCPSVGFANFCQAAIFLHVGIKKMTSPWQTTGP